MAEQLPADQLAVERYSCPLCDWTHEEPRSNVSNDTLASVFGPGVMTMVAATQRSQRIEDALKTHFATHTAEQWLKKVTSLQAERELLERQRDATHDQLIHLQNETGRAL